ncbi:DUF6042 family protein [Streptomyces sp. NPDC057101]|uniref:DUF6042 family protein n=1 Tax=Streptomyces sp. NPDC057101 TaxID=3346020 RepID=UPI0036254D10
MSVDQDTNQRNDDGYLSMHTGWFASGWPSYLPQHQSMTLCMLFGTASVRELRGDLDDILQQVFKGEPGAFFGRNGETLDSPVVWFDEDELADVENDEEKNQLRADSAAHQSKCEHLYRAAGLPVPTTIRELADTMLAAGIATLHDGAWTMPEDIPGPEDVLPLPDEDRARIAGMRRVWENGHVEQAPIDYLEDDLNRPDELFTSVDRLAKATEASEDDIRHALGRLLREGEARIERGTDREQAVLEDLQDHERFHLVLDWQHFNENRITIRRG